MVNLCYNEDVRISETAQGISLPHAASNDQEGTSFMDAFTNSTTDSDNSNGTPMNVTLDELLAIAQAPSVLDACIERWGVGYAAFWFVVDGHADEIRDENLHIINQASLRLLEEIRVREIYEAGAPDPAVLARAVFVMNDWSGGQFENLMYFDNYHTLDTLLQYQHQATIALLFGQQDLDDNGRYVALRLLQILREHIDHAVNSGSGGAAAQKTITPIRRDAPGYVYLIQSPSSAYKIGRARNPHNRMKTFGVQLPFEVEFVALIQTDDMYGLERRLHDRFHAKRINGEWFALTPEDVDYIKGLVT